jgi:hypothetical protein
LRFPHISTCGKSVLSAFHRAIGRYRISGGKQRYCRARHSFSGGGADSDVPAVGDEKLAKAKKNASGKMLEAFCKLF